MKKSFELGNVASSQESSGLEEQSEERLKELKKKLVGQMAIPVYQKKHFWSPDFVKCDGKIIRYDMRALGIWRASLHVKLTAPLFCSVIFVVVLQLLFLVHAGAGQLFSHNLDGLGNLAAHGRTLHCGIPNCDVRDHHAVQ